MTPRPTQIDLLDAVIATAQRARNAAAAGNLFATTPGHALVNAIHDLTEVDGLYDFAADIAHTLAADEPLTGPAERFLVDMARAA